MISSNSCLHFLSSLLLALAASSFLLFTTAKASPQYNLPAGADELLTEPVKTGFSCEGRNYGYFADIENNCQLFHICFPVEDGDGNILTTNQWTFLCSNGTRFDQQTLSCNFEEDSIPCEESEQFFDAVKFGVEDDERK